MRKKLKERKLIILAIFLMTGVAIAGWAFAFHYDTKLKSPGSQKEFSNDILEANVMPPTLDHSRIILLLVSTGLIGFFGVRRKSKTVKKFVTNNRLKIKLRINLLTEDNLESKTCHLWKTGCVAR